MMQARSRVFEASIRSLFALSLLCVGACDSDDQDTGSITTTGAESTPSGTDGATLDSSMTDSSSTTSNMEDATSTDGPDSSASSSETMQNSSDEQDSSQSTDTSTQDDAECIGVDPEGSLRSLQRDGYQDDDPMCTSPACVGDPAPFWQLHDHQPLSCGFGKDYGFDVFIGRPTFVALLAGWCPYCQGQAGMLEKMRLELEAQGHEMNFLVINGASANTSENRQNLLDRCSFPLFQDTAYGKVWELHAGGKDDMYLYGADGHLRAFLPHGGDVPTNLSTDEGYSAVRDLLLETLSE